MCELCHCQLKLSPLEQYRLPTHTHTHLEGVYTYQIMTDHPLHCSVPPQGVVTTVSGQMRKEAAAHRRGIIGPADSFYFHVIRLLYFITPLQDCQVTFGQSFSRNCFNLLVFCFSLVVTLCVEQTPIGFSLISDWIWICEHLTLFLSCFYVLVFPCMVAANQENSQQPSLSPCECSAGWLSTVKEQCLSVCADYLCK